MIMLKNQLQPFLNHHHNLLSLKTAIGLLSVSCSFKISKRLF